jgi:hypothetical protein
MIGIRIGPKFIVVGEALKFLAGRAAPDLDCRLVGTASQAPTIGREGETEDRSQATSYVEFASIRSDGPDRNLAIRHSYRQALSVRRERQARYSTITLPVTDKLVPLFLD